MTGEADAGQPTRLAVSVLLLIVVGFMFCVSTYAAVVFQLLAPDIPEAIPSAGVFTVIAGVSVFLITAVAWQPRRLLYPKS